MVRQPVPVGLASVIGVARVLCGRKSYLLPARPIELGRGPTGEYCAAGLLAPQAQAIPPMAVKVNVGRTANVLEAARLFDLGRVAYCSSKAIYRTITGEHGYPTYQPIDED